MRKIVSKEIENKKKKRNQIVIGLVLVGLMLLSTAGYSFMKEDDSTAKTNKVDYNGFQFVNNNGLWTLSLGNFNFVFSLNPNEVDAINGSTINVLSSYSGKPLYISSESPETELELYRNLDQVVLRRQYACLEGEKCKDSQFPIKTCKDNFIIIGISNLSSITQNENCVFIKGQQQDLIKLSDEFLFKILSIK